MVLPQEKFYTEEDYESLPENVHAELIDGRIYYQAAPNRRHQKILMEMAGSIRAYIKVKGGDCEVYPAPFAVKLFADEATIVEPDISVICDRSKLTDRGCTGAPDWIIEIVSQSNSAHDYVHKLGLYMKAGVEEYWIVDPASKAVLVYCFKEEAFNVRQYTFDDKIKAGIYDDFWIDFKEMDFT
ncbi:MAG: Uma2 family endonuclease [Lachnospiraceae bacterium]|nr:Uma2 family endonuclease [Lachnospiraceae bacterium]